MRPRALVGAPSASSRVAALLRTRLSGLLLVVLLLLLWEASARLEWVASSNWPPFSTSLVEAIRGLASGELLAPLLSTLSRMFAGYALGAAIGVGLGLLVGFFAPLRHLLAPLIETLRPIPIPAIVPPLILFLGLGDALKIFVVAFACFFPVFVNTIGGVRDVGDVLLQTAKTFRVSRAATLRKVVLPAALPSIFAGLRISLALALVVAVVAEMIAGSGGIGYRIIESQYAMQPSTMYASVIWLSVIGYLLNWVFLKIETRLLHWYGDARQ
jgi:ABC-type nitrate/sulfonate/bicarbonate transport system permease component